jgi:hypothetical protein
VLSSLEGRGKGVPLTDAHKRKIARSMQRSLATPEHRAKISAANRGKRKTCRLCGELVCAANPTREREREREELVCSHGRWKHPCLQTAHMSI